MPLGFGHKTSTTDPIQTIGEEVDSDALPEDIKAKVNTAPLHETLDDDEAAKKLKLFREQAQNDPNIPTEDLDLVDNAVEGHDVSKENDLVNELVEDSPYPEVRAAVRNYDVDVPANTIRAWVIGMTMTTIFSGLNMLFSLRSPSITITSIVAQLVAYPIGVGWSLVMPDRQFKLGSIEFNLNPGPFNFKEHGLIVLMANAAYGSGAGYFTDILTAQRAFYGFDWGWGYAILLGLTTQCIGFGIAGLARIWLVEPASMIWPTNLVNSTFMYTLHDHSKTDPAKANGWTIGRYRYFFYVFLASFCWYWIPGYLFQALSVFAFPTFIAPDNVTVNQVFGGWTGMGLLPITFDWTQITGYVYSPLIPPWHAIANTMIGVVFFFWFVAAGIHWTGTWYSDWLPFSDSGSWDNTQNAYNVSQVMTSDFTLDIAKYEAYSPLFLSTTFALCYGLSFAGISSVIVHTGLFHAKDIWRRFRERQGTLDDTHAKMMRKYKPVPQWWFLCIFVPCLALSFVTSYVWPTGLTWWALIVAVIISMVWMIPIGMVQATTNIQIGLNVFTEFLIGYILPGRPNAMMMFKTYGYITMTQGLAFVQDMKLGHYLKLPPRTMFFGQLIATLWSCLVQVAVFYWAMGAIDGICTTDAVARFTCPNGRVFFTASVIWGLIGPQRIFSGTGIYKNLQFFWIAGVALPIIFWIMQRKWPKSWVRYLSAPIIFSGNGSIPPATPLNYLTWGLVGFIFNKWIRDKWRGWWMRFNYVTSAGLDSGLAVCTIIIVLALSLTNTDAPNWWGNSKALNTMDYNDEAWYNTVADGETFGPATW
ncbi:small oligopeptide transporter [Xylariales sp. AK1849]|nr:small oligopeptide transporter [Xylariales sp. AK1849]